jgi:hypothetical protein
LGTAATTTSIKRQDIEQSLLLRPVHLFPARKIKIQRSKTAGPMPIIASKAEAL